MEPVKIKFAEGNRIRYSQDFLTGKIGLPSNVEFEIAAIDHHGVVLVGPGHGQAGNYGLGRIRVYWPTRTSDDIDFVTDAKDLIEHWLVKEFWGNIVVPMDESNVDALVYNAVELLWNGEDYTNYDDACGNTIYNRLSELRHKYGMPREWDPVIDAMKDAGLALNTFHMVTDVLPPFTRGKCVILRRALSGDELTEIADWFEDWWPALRDKKVIAWMVADLWALEAGDED